MRRTLASPRSHWKETQDATTIQGETRRVLAPTVRALQADCESLESAIFWRRVASRREPIFLLQFSADAEQDLALLANEYEAVLLSQQELLSHATERLHQQNLELRYQRDQIADLRQQLRGVRQTERVA